LGGGGADARVVVAAAAGTVAVAVGAAAGDAGAVAGVAHLPERALEVYRAAAFRQARPDGGVAEQIRVLAVGVGCAAGAVLAEPRRVAELLRRAGVVGAAVASAGLRFAAEG